MNNRAKLAAASALIVLSAVSCIPLRPVQSEQTTVPEVKNAQADEATTIDSSEDDRALGYPNQRKIVSDSAGRLFVAYRKQHRVNNALQYHIFVARADADGRAWQVLNDGKPVEDVGAFTQRVPALAIGADDSLHLVWYGADAQNKGANQRQIKYTRSSDGGQTWLPWRNIAPVDGYSEPQRLWQEHPEIVVDRGTVYVIWQGRDGADTRRSQVRMTVSRDGGDTWEPGQTVQRSASGGRSRPVLLVSPDDGVLHVLAYGEGESRQQIVYTRSTDGGAISSPWSAISSSENDQRHVSAALDSRGRVHAAWREGGKQTRAFIRYSALNTGVWSPAVAVDSASPHYQFFPSLAVAADDRVVLTWIETSGLSGFPEEEFRTGLLRWSAARAGSDRWSVASSLGSEEPVNFVSVSANAVAGNRVDVVWSQPLGDKRTLLRYRALHLR